MTNSKSTEDFVAWSPGDPTRHAPNDAKFLDVMHAAGCDTFTGPLGLFGAASGHREVHVIHRGMGRRWEVFFIENNHDVLVTITTNLPNAKESALGWLRGEPLRLKTDAFAEATH